MFATYNIWFLSEKIRDDIFDSYIYAFKLILNYKVLKAKNCKQVFFTAKNTWDFEVHCRLEISPLMVMAIFRLNWSPLEENLLIKILGKLPKFEK